MIENPRVGIKNLSTNYLLARAPTAICNCIYCSCNTIDLLVSHDFLRNNSITIQSFHCSIDNPADLLVH